MIKAEDYGLELEKANELTIGLKVVKSERELLIKEFEEVSKLELIQENLPKFKELRLKIVKNRTQGINKWHKTNKEFFLTGGKFVDAIKNKENSINEQMEEKLMDAEKHFENLEKERLEKLQFDRINLVSKYIEDAHLIDLSRMDQDVFDAYLSIKKKAHLDRVKAELDAEKERQAEIKAEKEAIEKQRLENEKLKKEAKIREEKLNTERLESERLAKIEAEKREKEEDERNEKARLEHLAQVEKERKANAEYEAKLKVEREAKEKIEREEKEKREKLEAELKAKLDAEIKAKEDEEYRIQAELSKGDSDKVKDLINDLIELKTKYVFKSVKNKQTYSNVSDLIDKIITYINK